ncbi:sialomucin core protein 24 isoform X2 [Phascolarctos cinereus]|uniref:Sialomucin core protein 24 isoform X2 n=1 Tax=Phascolarctos cinereus TaxID=38626 RepID=A0A6P5M5R6_PHACI|nr:sialomucin core protein 24 isoform X2 [Phascolarctos cinereus]
MNGMRGPSRPLFWAAAAYLAALCVLSAAEASAPTANFNESSSVPPTMMNATQNSTTKAPLDPSPTPTPAPTPTQAPAPESCKEYTNCSSCLESKNATCFWTVCNGPGYCSENAATPNCTVVNSSSNCLVEPTASPSPTNSTAKPSPAASTTPAVSTVVTSGAANATVIPTPSTRKSTFDAASFIGGIVLVLSVQAVVFFLFKFCKSKERNYHTL